MKHRRDQRASYVEHITRVKVAIIPDTFKASEIDRVDNGEETRLRGLALVMVVAVRAKPTVSRDPTCCHLPETDSAAAIVDS